ncbi:MAG TPA: AarF/ABC1/UbiB kinase family protein [Chthoniobacterales bacterium]|jgi:predicted unusual protein kinase regulating ubiquinone biosynthesis (AarF/ABC1/UbiB family)
MGISLNPQHLKRYQQIAWIFMKYGRSDLVKTTGLSEALQAEQRVAPEEIAKANELAGDLEKLGPTFVKLGQLLSTRVELLPQAYLEALARLQDKVEPFSFAEVERIVANQLGVRISKAFATFEDQPMAAASLGQVHRATLRDGRPVAVKVQRPGIREEMVQDLDALEDIADFLDQHTELGRRYEFCHMLEQFRKSLLQELDYRQEAGNLTTLSRDLRKFEHIIIPAPIDQYCTSRVLTMEFVPGKKITDLSPLARMEFDGAALAEELFRAYLEQILVNGFFHADPHPGNVFITADHRIALLDLGMVGRIMPRLQEDLLQLLMAISEGRGDEAANIAIKIGEKKDDFDSKEFTRRISGIVAQQKAATVEQMQVGRLVLAVTQTSAENSIRVPPELTMLGKTLLNLDQVGRALEPEFNPNASIRRNAAEILQQRLVRSLSPGNLFSGVLELKDLLQRLPSRLNKIIDAISNNELKVSVDAIDERTLIVGFQKVANRITVGLILASLIVGAAMLMRVETSFRIWGYPGLAIIFFLVAAGGGIALLINILFYDKSNRD